MKKLLPVIASLFICSFAFSQITLTSTVTNVSCFGGTNGSATITATGGTAPYTYTWLPGNSSPTTLTSAAAGQYTVIAEDAVANTNSLVITIIEPSTLTATTMATNALCFGTATGAIHISASGGTPTYFYNLNGGAYQSSSTFTNIFAGVYTVGIKDANNCIGTQTAQVNQPTQLNMTTSSQNANCSVSNGVASSTVTGGTPIYTYSWTPSGGAATVSNGLSAGNYTITSTDANGCTVSSPVVIGLTSGGTATVSAKTNATCNGLCDGSITIGTIGGSAPFTYSWTPSGQTNSTATNLCPGTYSCTIIDFYGCTSTAVATITQPSQLISSTTLTNVTCAGMCNGAFNTIASGGVAPYIFFNSIGSIGPNITNVCAGTLTTSVRDANNCLLTETITITQPPLLSAVVTSTNTNCAQSDGALCSAAFGGTPPYNYLWSNGTTTTSCNSNLPAGVYTYTVADANGCLNVGNGLVNDIGGPVISITSQTNVSCFGGNNGAATTSVTGGTSPYAYAWAPAGGTLSSLTNIGAGMYGVTVTDASGCIGTQTVSITQPTQLNILTSSSNAACGMCNGSIVASAMGGSPAYMYTWLPSGGITSFLQNLCAGNYTIQITDSNGCIKTATTSVLSIGTGSLTNVTTTLTTIKESCLNFYDGSIDLALSGSNTGPFTYQWSNGATTQDIFSVTANYYSVTIFDASMNCLSVGDSVKTDGTNCGSISGKVFIDNNSDCTFNSGDNSYNYAQIIANPGNKLGYTNTNGDYIINNLPFGTYSLTALTTNTNLMSTCVTTVITTLNAGSPNSINNNFSREYIPITQPDLCVLASCSGIVPGFICTVNYNLYNYNSFIASGFYKVTLPSAFIPNITQVSASTYTISGDTIIWNFNNSINGSGSQLFFVKFTTPLSTPLGSIFTTCMWAQPTVTDLNYANNNYCYSRNVSGSFDPNDKTVSPVGIGTNGDIAASVTDLTYLIRFQNTGNGPAVNIVVKDTLSPNVDINTFEMLGSSHNYNIDILNGNILRWKFNNIMLADSNSNEPASHGYIQYRIKRTTNNTPGTQIKNTAYIYFDFNAPVVTNRAINTIETVTGIKSPSSSDNEWNVYPNPSTGTLYIVNHSSFKEASQIQILNSIGQTVFEETITSNYKNIDLSKLNNGIYFVKIVSDKQSTVKRIVLSK